MAQAIKSYPDNAVPLVWRGNASVVGMDGVGRPQHGHSRPVTTRVFGSPTIYLVKLVFRNTSYGIRIGFIANLMGGSNVQPALPKIVFLRGPRQKRANLVHPISGFDI